MEEALLTWLLDSGEPWTRYRTLTDLQGLDRGDLEVQAARKAMVEHPHIKALIESVVSWPGYGLKRHNDAKHPLHQLSALADFGLKSNDPGMDDVISKVMAHQDTLGPFQTYSHLYKRFAGVDGEYWTWMMCDAPTLLYALLSFGLQDDPQVQDAIEHLQGIIRENGWPCAGGEPLKPTFKGPGKREDPCPYANLISLKTLAQYGISTDSKEASAGLEVLLRHWDHAYERKLYLFATGSAFRKVKYPLVWYDILHVAEVLSYYPSVYSDSRFISLINELASGDDVEGKYTATSMYQAWKGWSFADKKNPSPWLTFMILRIFKRVETAQPRG